MIRAIVFLVILAFAIAALVATEHAAPNGDLPLVKAAVPMFPDVPTWRLYMTCPVDRRNVPIVEERTA